MAFCFVLLLVGTSLGSAVIHGDGVDFQIEDRSEDVGFQGKMWFAPTRVRTTEADAADGHDDVAVETPPSSSGRWVVERTIVVERWEAAEVTNATCSSAVVTDLLMKALMTWSVAVRRHTVTLLGLWMGIALHSVVAEELPNVSEDATDVWHIISNSSNDTVNGSDAPHNATPPDSPESPESGSVETTLAAVQARLAMLERERKSPYGSLAGFQLSRETLEQFDGIFDLMIERMQRRMGGGSGPAPPVGGAMEPPMRPTPLGGPPASASVQSTESPAVDDSSERDSHPACVGGSDEDVCGVYGRVCTVRCRGTAHPVISRVEVLLDVLDKCPGARDMSPWRPLFDAVSSGREWKDSNIGPSPEQCPEEFDRIVRLWHLKNAAVPLLTPSQTRVSPAEFALRVPRDTIGRQQVCAARTADAAVALVEKDFLGSVTDGPLGTLEDLPNHQFIVEGIARNIWNRHVTVETLAVYGFKLCGLADVPCLRGFGSAVSEAVRIVASACKPAYLREPNPAPSVSAPFGTEHDCIFEKITKAVSRPGQSWTVDMFASRDPLIMKRAQRGHKWRFGVRPTFGEECGVIRDRSVRNTLPIVDINGMAVGRECRGRVRSWLESMSAAVVGGPGSYTAIPGCTFIGVSNQLYEVPTASGPTFAEQEFCWWGEVWIIASGSAYRVLGRACATEDAPIAVHDCYARTRVVGDALACLPASTWVADVSESVLPAVVAAVCAGLIMVLGWQEVVERLPHCIVMVCCVVFMILGIALVHYERFRGCYMAIPFTVITMVMQGSTRDAARCKGDVYQAVGILAGSALVAGVGLHTQGSLAACCTGVLMASFLLLTAVYSPTEWRFAPWRVKVAIGITAAWILRLVDACSIAAMFADDVFVNDPGTNALMSCVPRLRWAPIWMERVGPFSVAAAAYWPGLPSFWIHIAATIGWLLVQSVPLWCVYGLVHGTHNGRVRDVLKAVPTMLMAGLQAVSGTVDMRVTITVAQVWGYGLLCTTWGCGPVLVMSFIVYWIGCQGHVSRGELQVDMQTIHVVPAVVRSQRTETEDEKFYRSLARSVITVGPNDVVGVVIHPHVIITQQNPLLTSCPIGRDPTIVDPATTKGDVMHTTADGVMTRQEVCVISAQHVSEAPCVFIHSVTPAISAGDRGTRDGAWSKECPSTVERILIPYLSDVGNVAVLDVSDEGSVPTTIDGMGGCHMSGIVWVEGKDDSGHKVRNLYGTCDKTSTGQLRLNKFPPNVRMAINRSIHAMTPARQALCGQDGDARTCEGGGGRSEGDGRTREWSDGGGGAEGRNDGHEGSASLTVRASTA